MAELWGREGAIPAPFQHVMQHLSIAFSRWEDVIDGGPVVDDPRGELDKTVAEGSTSSAESTRETMRHLVDMPELDADRVDRLRETFDRQEDAAADIAGRNRP